MQPILLLQSHEFPSEMGYPTIYKNNAGQDLFVDIKNCLDREKWMLHIRMEPSGLEERGWKLYYYNYSL